MFFFQAQLHIITCNYILFFSITSQYPSLTQIAYIFTGYIDSLGTLATSYTTKQYRYDRQYTICGKKPQLIINLGEQFIVYVFLLDITLLFPSILFLFQPIQTHIHSVWRRCHRIGPASHYGTHCTCRAPPGSGTLKNSV